jgi:hypothetical protein
MGLLTVSVSNRLRMHAWGCKSDTPLKSIGSELFW